VRHECAAEHTPSRRGTPALSLSRRQAWRRAQAPPSRWARPGAACQWARRAQLRLLVGVNHAPQLALPAAAGIRAPRPGSAVTVAPRLRPGAWPGTYRPGAYPGAYMYNLE
jgi:hypothetical protein